jgi:hypothetical protein
MNDAAPRLQRDDVGTIRERMRALHAELSGTRTREDLRIGARHLGIPLRKNKLLLGNEAELTVLFDHLNYSYGQALPEEILRLLQAILTAQTQCQPMQAPQEGPISLEGPRQRAIKSLAQRMPADRNHILVGHPPHSSGVAERQSACRATASR